MTSNENKFFKNINFIKYPLSQELVLFSCDDLYFKKFGIYNVCSCDKVEFDVHCHIINPSSESLELIKKLEKKLKINFSYSIEFLDTLDLNFYALKSYYYCSRFYIAIKLFESHSISKLHIVDTDMIFNEKIIMPNNINLSLEYNNSFDNLWQKIMAGYIFITKSKIQFLKDVLSEYENIYDNINFDEVSLIENKIQKANLTGLDQVCLSYIFEKNNLEKNNDFFNLLPVKKEYKSKGDGEAKMWMILGKTKNVVEPYLKEKFKEYIK
jgi:hypothetical protein